MLYEKIVELIGVVPVGFEPLVYIGSILVLLFLLQTVSSILWTLLNWIGGK